MPETLGAWLRQQREARSWTRREMARQLIQAGRGTGDTTVGTTSCVTGSPGAALVPALG